MTPPGDRFSCNPKLRRQFEIETMMKELERDRPQIEKLIERYRD